MSILSDDEVKLLIPLLKAKISEDQSKHFDGKLWGHEIVNMSAMQRLVARLSASSPVDSREGLIERCAQIADAAALAAAAMKDRKDAKSASGTAILTGYIFAETEAKAIATKIRAIAAKEQPCDTKS